MAEESFDPLTPSRPRPAGPGDADTESIKREIEQTRVVMSETIGEIQERLRPDQLLQHAKDGVRADDWLSKPFGLDTLLARVKTLIGEA